MKRKKKKKPISKTQGRWWIIRRPNGSIARGVLEHTQRVAWDIYVLISLANPRTLRNSVVRQLKEDGYTCERVQVMSTEDNGVVIESMTFNKDGTLASRTRGWMSIDALRLTTNPDDPVRVRARKERKEEFAKMRERRQKGEIKK